MDYKITCQVSLDGEEMQWECNLNIYHICGEYVEIDIQGRGSDLHVIVGPQINGFFACIPALDAGCELARYQDYGWNLTHLRTALSGNFIDAVTIATALKYLPQILGKKE